MTDQPDEAFAEAWQCVLRARTASPTQLPALAARITDALERDPGCSGSILRLAVAHRMAYLLLALAEAAHAAHTGPLDRLAAAAVAEQDELEECWEEPEDDDEQLPA